MQLARDATSSGDRVTAESYFQHAEHYYRMMTANGPVPNVQSPNGHDDADDANGTRGNDRSDAELTAPGTGPQPDVTGGNAQPNVPEETVVDAASTSRDGDDGQEPASA